jgi:hypothetical protein
LKGLREAPKSLQRHIPSRPNRNLQAALARKVEEEASPARKGTRARVESPLGERSLLLAYQVTAEIGIVNSYINFAACFASSARGLNRVSGHVVLIGVSVQTRLVKLRAGARWWRSGSWSGKGLRRLRMAGGEAENAERRERESDVEKNGMEEPLEEAAPNARRIYREGKKLNQLAH